MIDRHEKFRMPDESGKENHFFMEVNWKADDEKSNECKVIKVTFPDKSEAYLKREYLHAVIFAISKEEEQRNLVPQKLTNVKWYETVLSVKATKDIRKGENITFPIKLSLPPTEKETIG